MKMKLYAERDIENLDSYIDHVSAMTGEKLHSKSSIAAELAFRDEQIKSLNSKMDKHLQDVVCHFGAWLVNHHEQEFSGGEEQIAMLCSDFVTQLKVD